MVTSFGVADGWDWLLRAVDAYVSMRPYPSTRHRLSRWFVAAVEAGVMLYEIVAMTVTGATVLVGSALLRDLLFRRSVYPRLARHTVDDGENTRPR